MSNSDYGPNAFVKSVIEDNDFIKDSIDITQYNNMKIRHKICEYNPQTHGEYFLKNILFQFASSFSNDELMDLDRIKNRLLSGGITINYGKRTVNLDFLQALEEIQFLKSKLPYVNSILEIGCGYGRTCHAILQSFSNIEEYCLVDLPEMLKLSSAYLKNVLD